MPPPVFKHFRPAALIGVALATLLLAGCAQQREPGYYATNTESTLSDAQYQAQGHSRERAPSQIQLGFGKEAKPAAPASPSESKQAANAATVRPLTEAKTFLGTIPCLTSAYACSAARVTITLAPNGEWRSRTVVLDAANANATTTEQGCWEVVGSSPWRIILQTPNKTNRANLTFINDNVLRVNSINEVKPTLDHHLTRQPDVDAINELTNAAALQCAS
jgi:hypothetical protein